MQVPLVRSGADEHLPNGEHTFHRVYGEMMIQICVEYQVLPDPRTLTAQEIEFFYDGIRSSLKRQTLPKG